MATKYGYNNNIVQVNNNNNNLFNVDCFDVH